MILALQIILELLGLLLLVLSLQWTFTLDKMSNQHQIEYSGSTGANYLKGDIAGILLAGSIMVFLMLFQDKLWFYPIALLLISVIINRSLSLIVDGYTKQGAIAIIVEIVMVVLSYGYYTMT